MLRLGSGLIELFHNLLLNELRPEQCLSPVCVCVSLRMVKLITARLVHTG